MAQQINLYSPILMAPRRYFSALAMLQALAVYVLLLVGLGAWAVHSTSALQSELQRSTKVQAAEHAQLTRALAELAPKPGAGTAIEQEIARLQAALALQRQQVDELSRGRVIEGRSHAATLDLVARTVPAPVWLTDLRLLEGRLELTGMTLQPQTLRPWLSRLAVHPLTAGQRLAAVKVERSVGNAVPLPQGVEAWSFNVVSSSPHLDANGRPRGAR